MAFYLRAVSSIWDAQIEENLRNELSRRQNEFFRPHSRDIMLDHHPVEVQLKAFLDDYPVRSPSRNFCPTGIATMINLWEDVVDGATRRQERYKGM
ncbi:MAG: hypothetical protein ACI9P7_001386 [Candidatus Azotimanducaceae bacterium]|jgi:hypothetical protein